ncbi:hypothetical protein GS471_05330 [Rhodococcus hoagii]|nr:hypothetical protein [Prescottella equi]
MDRVEVFELQCDAPAVPDDHSTPKLAAEVGALLGVQGVVPRMAFQHMVPWAPGEADEAFRQGARAMVPDADELGAVDFALLLDGVKGNWHYQAEAGVIRAEDAPLRLARQVGRSNAFTPDTWVLRRLDEVSFPEVSTFVDSSWHLPGKLPVLFEEAEDLALRVETLATEVVEILHHRIHPL